MGDVNQLELIERREHDRTAVNLSAVVTAAGREGPVQLIDLSLNGALIVAKDRFLRLGDGCTLTIPFGRDPAEALCLAARVIRRERRAIAVRWTVRPQPDDLLKLGRLMERSIGQPCITLGAVPMLVWPILRARHRR